jgi:hypothetical protein
LDSTDNDYTYSVFPIIEKVKASKQVFSPIPPILTLNYSKSPQFQCSQFDPVGDNVTKHTLILVTIMHRHKCHGQDCKRNQCIISNVTNHTLVFCYNHAQA